ncbi:MAG TPA: ADP-ribosylglycohydrolase family protein, partial [Nostoc sp.]|uniref:ADP-ribosylglycohydrolase family protein n=1 Tax=Nostoc sp. TaxID=1180 RepID=UPI002D428CA7
MIVNNDLSRYVQHPRFQLNPGSYTDDTQMSIAITEVIVAQAPWTVEVLADSFVRAFKRDEREGYARSFYHFLQRIQDGEEFLTKINPESDKRGRRCVQPPLASIRHLKKSLR